MLNIVVISGAGLSVESGIRPYRGETGIYTEMMERYDRPAEELVTRKVLEREPELFWDLWERKMLMLSQAAPCDAHRALVNIASKSNFLEITQNVDGLSRMAGMPNDSLIELHGNARNYTCMTCGVKHDLWIRKGMGVQRCYRCKVEGGALIRPGVVMFNEMINIDHYQRARLAARNADLFVVVGTTLQFDYLLEFLHLSYINMADTIYIDPQVKSLTDVHLDGIHEDARPSGYFRASLATTATKGLRLLDECIESDMGKSEEVMVQLRSKWQAAI
jgi:NAD-dependent deacetylase